MSEPPRPAKPLMPQMREGYLCGECGKFYCAALSEFVSRRWHHFFEGHWPREMTLEDWRKHEDT